MAVALHVAHRRGVLHRDVKPHNIFRSVYGDPALGDFGISTLAGERSHDRSTALSLAYVAPEILDDAPPSAQADVYSLAATLHHLATGRAPFDGKEPSRVVNQVLHDEPPPIGRSDLPASFERALRMGMAKDPAQRPADAAGVRRGAARGPGACRPLADGAQAGHRRGAHRRPSGAPRRRGRQHRRARGPRTPPAASRAALVGHVEQQAIRDVRSPAAHLESSPVVGPPAERSAVESTVVRRAPAPPRPEPDVEPGPGRRRIWIASALAVVAVAAVILAIVIAGGGSSSTTSTTATPSSIPPDSFFAPLGAPTGVTVTQAADGGGGFAVAVPVVSGATAYEIERTIGGDVVTVQAGQLPVTVDGKGASTLCVVVRALGADGRVSRDGGPFCSG